VITYQHAEGMSYQGLGYGQNFFVLLKAAPVLLLATEFNHAPFDPASDVRIRIRYRKGTVGQQCANDEFPNAAANSEGMDFARSFCVKE
jgi:hypothetical protein